MAWLAGERPMALASAHLASASREKPLSAFNGMKISMASNEDENGENRRRNQRRRTLGWPKINTVQYRRNKSKAWRAAAAWRQKKAPPGVASGGGVSPGGEIG
jgi:hypothetical protein